MAISPKDAARVNDERIANAVKNEEARIDGILASHFYTDGPPVEMDAPEVDEPVRQRLMQVYNKAGWRIEVRPRGDEFIWKFTRL